MVKRNLVADVVVYYLQQAVPRQTFSPKRNGPHRRRRVERILTAVIAFVHPAASPVSQNLMFDPIHMQSFVVCSFRICLRVFYHLHPRTETSALMAEHNVGTKKVAVRSGSHHPAHKTQKVFNNVLLEHIVDVASLTLRIASVVRNVCKYHTHVSVECTARPQLIQVFKIRRSSIPSQAVVFNGCLPHPKSGPSFRPQRIEVC